MRQHACALRYGYIKGINTTLILLFFWGRETSVKKLKKRHCERTGGESQGLDTIGTKTQAVLLEMTLQPSYYCFGLAQLAKQH
jgi:hypothetical protein